VVSTRLFTVFCFALALSAGVVFAGGRTLWQDGGVQLCGPSAWKPVTAMSDDAGGAIAVWTDARVWPYGIFTQRVDASGVPQWAQDGVLLRDSTYMGFLAGTDDGRHGALVVMSGGGEAFAVQRVGADGVPLWGPDGEMLRPPSDSIGVWPALVGDGHGGVVVVWSTQSIYFQTDTLIACRVDSSGSKRWETLVRVDTLGEASPCLCSDGEGGVIVAWSGYESGVWRVQVQRIDSAGVIRWGTAGVLACTLSTTQDARACVAAGESCFVVGFHVRANSIWKVHAQALDMVGSRQWGLGSVPVTASSYSASGCVGMSAGEGGRSVWLWSENRTGTTELFAQKLDSAGNRCWDTTGVWLGTINTSGGQLTATVDGRRGAIAAWTLYRSSQNWDIYAQHVDSSGRLCWNDTGLAVCRDTSNSTWPAAVSDGGGGAIITWLDDRGLYAQRVADGAGIAEAMNDERGVMSAGPTVVRGVLFLPIASSRKLQAASLLDVSGRVVMDLHVGANDVSQLAPGVYFTRGVQARARVQSIHRIVITR